MDAQIDSILQRKYPAKSHCRGVVSYLKKNGSTPTDDAVLYLEAAQTRMNEDNDQEAPFRQRRYFFYLTGCELPDSAIVYDTTKDRSTLFIPPVDPDEVVWSGLPMGKEEAMKKYDIDDVKTTNELNSFLNGSETPKQSIFAIGNQVSDKVTFLSFDEKDVISLKPAIEECRVVKDEYEIALTRQANIISEIAHRAVMKAVKQAKNEKELEGLFLERCITNGCHTQAYSTIMASGTDAATLHYVKNDKPITSSQLNMLLDGGGESKCYAADITRTFPIHGKFTQESRHIYEIVLTMQKNCTSMLKEGISWDMVHETAHKIAIEGLLKIGILKGDPTDILHANISAAFFPHGLGHFLGMDTHDCGGHPNYSDPDPKFRYLRVRRRLPAGSIITVEPGIYFCRFIIQPYLDKPELAKYIDQSVLEKYWQVGGVRIEDNVLITQDGYQNLTTVPKEIDEMEAIINS